MTDNSQESEYDTMVIENAGDVIPALAKVVGGETFIPIFANFLPEFMKRMVSGDEIIIHTICIAPYNTIL